MRIDGIVFEQTVTSDNVSDLFSRLNAGDVIKCRIMDVTPGNVLLKLYDGSTFTASPRVDIDVRRGDLLTLLVKSKDTGQIILEILNSDSNLPKDSSTNLVDVLFSLNIKADSTNLEIARELNAFNAPLGKDAIELIAQSIKTIGNITAEKAAYLYANKMPINESNVNLLTQLAEGKFKISSSIENLFNLIDGTRDTSFYKALENDFSMHELFNCINIKNSSGLDNFLKTYSSNISQDTNNNTGNVHDTNNVNNVNNVYFANDVHDAAGMLEKLIAGNIVFKTDAAANLNLIDSYAPDDFKALFESYLRNNVESFENLSDNDKGVLIDSIYSALKKLSADKSKITKDFTYQDEFDYQKDNSSVHEDKLTDPVQRSFKQTHVNLVSNNLSKEMDLKSIYRDILTKLDIIKSRIDEYQNVPGREEMAKVLNNIEANIRFMNELYSHTIYMQFPVNMWNKNATGELYILRKNSRRKKLNADEITVFISLDTSSLGCIDTLLTVKGKSISLNISTESTEIADFVKGNYRMLYDSLLNKGYKLIDMKCRVREKERNLMQLHKEMIEESKKIRTGRVDLRV
ncbi:MAG TPA: flagellar hook-length control protein FliK [Clostridiaceae bacterium]|nr:flagellar hook-length control protein FliK [Clostridiaceae bacterium]